MTPFVNNTTTISADWLNGVDALVNGVFRGVSTIQQARTSLGLIGTLAEQSPTAINFTGGYLDGVHIGTRSGDGVPYVRSSRVEVTQDPANPNDAVRLSYFTSRVEAITSSKIAALNATLGTMAFQSLNSIRVTGGTIDGVVLGAVTPATGTFSELSVQTSPVQPTNVVTLAYLNTRLSVIGSIGTMSGQNANAVIVSGGTINGATIGASTPSSGAFTTLSVNDSAPTVGTAVVNKAYLDARLSGASSGFGDMALQNKSNVTLLGGTINNVSIGSTTPAAAYFTASQISAAAAEEKLITPGASSTDSASVGFYQSTAKFGELTFVPSSNSLYDSRFVNSLHLNATTLTFKSSSVVGVINNAAGLHLQYGSSASAVSLTATPSATFGNTGGFSGATRYYSGADYSIVQQFGANLHIDTNAATGSVNINTNTGSASLSVNRTLNAILFNRTAGVSVFNAAAYNVSESGSVQVSSGLVSDWLKSSQLLTNVPSSTANVLTTGHTIRTEGGVVGNRNSALRLVNASNSADQFQNSVGVDFSYGTPSAITVATGSDGKPRVAARVSALAALAVGEPKLTIEIDNVAADRTRVAAEFTTRRHLVLEGVTDSTLHSVQAAAPFKSAGADIVHVASTVSAVSTTLDAAVSRMFFVTLDSSTTFTISNLAAYSGTLVHIRLLLLQGAVGNRAVTFAAPVNWSAGVALNTVAAAANRIDIVDLFTVNGGTSFFGRF